MVHEALAKCLPPQCFGVLHDYCCTSCGSRSALPWLRWISKAADAVGAAAEVHEGLVQVSDDADGWCHL